MVHYKNCIIQKEFQLYIYGKLCEQCYKLLKYDWLIDIILHYQGLQIGKHAQYYMVLWFHILKKTVFHK